MTSFDVGDRVVATTDLGSGASRGTKGVVTESSVWHGLLVVRFETGREVKAVRLDQVERA